MRKIKIYLILILLSFTLFLYACNNNEPESSSEVQELRTEDGWYKGILQDGKPNGLGQLYTEKDGDLILFGIFEDGIIVNGKMYDEEGNVIYDGNFKNGIPVNQINNNSKTEIEAKNNSLKILDGWEWVQQGDYTYISGRVKNVSNKNISYFKVTAEYRDSNGDVLDTNYTNSNETIRPNNQKEFEIMHRHNNEYDTVTIFVEDIKFK